MSSASASAVAAPNKSQFDIPAGMDIMVWIGAACGWTIASMLFLVPAFYWFLLHGLAIVGFFSIATGKSKMLWPAVESTVATVQRIVEAIHWPQIIPHPPPNHPP